MDLESRVITVVRDNLEFENKVILESCLIDDLKVDSLGILMIITGLEDEFAIQIEESDFFGLKTIFDVVERLKENYSV